MVRILGKNSGDRYSVSITGSLSNWSRKAGADKLDSLCKGRPQWLHGMSWVFFSGQSDAFGIPATKFSAMRWECNPHQPLRRQPRRAPTLPAPNLGVKTGRTMAAGFAPPVTQIF